MSLRAYSPFVFLYLTLFSSFVPTIVAVQHASSKQSFHRAVSSMMLSPTHATQQPSQEQPQQDSGDADAAMSVGASTFSPQQIKSIRNSVVQIVCAHAAFNWQLPWQPAAEDEVLGTGFFVMMNGQPFIVTNGHVIKEAVTVRIRIPTMGQDDFAAEVVAVCYDKDVALLRVSSADQQNLDQRMAARGGKNQIEYLEFGNSDEFSQGSTAVAVGYPLGQANLKFSTGIASGMEHADDRFYIQVTAPINPGNSGGPLLNSKGAVMGINTAAMEKASNVGYAIPINHIRPLLEYLTARIPVPVSPVRFQAKDGDKSDSDSDSSTTTDNQNTAGAGVRDESIINKFPYLGIGLIPATSELGESLGYKGAGGVYVRKVAPRGICADAGIKDGDLLLEFEEHPFDRFGETQFGTQERMNLYDLAERVTVGKSVSFKIWRDGQELMKSAVFEHNPQKHSYAIEQISEPVIQKVGYMIVGGMVFMDLTLNHLDFLLESSPTLVSFYKGPNRLQSKVVVSSILPESKIPEGALGDGDILDKVNGIPVTSLAQLQEVMQKAHDQMKEKKGSNLISFETTEGSKVVLDLLSIVAKYGHAQSGTNSLDSISGIDIGSTQTDDAGSSPPSPSPSPSPAPVPSSSSDADVAPATDNAPEPTKTIDATPTETTTNTPQTSNDVTPQQPSFLMIRRAAHPTPKAKKAPRNRRIQFSH